MDSIHVKLMLILAFLCIGLAEAQGGDYMDSAHGSATAGVQRSAAELQSYSRGNCSHCHGVHASFEGTASPPHANALYAANFNVAASAAPYQESDNICFSCHNISGSEQQVTNYNYGRAFGCGTTGPTSIMEAFNEYSYHNLRDIWTFAKDNFDWFDADSNPCNACHNPHLAKRNWTEPNNPQLTAISSPADHQTLFGDDELMSQYPDYEPPYCNAPSREPGGGSTTDGSATPDYVVFCTACHNSTNNIYSSSLGRNVKKINWSPVFGDKHGDRDTDGSVTRYDSPYGTIDDYLLSCLDCHEPHGSYNKMLIRRQVNGAPLYQRYPSSQYPHNGQGALCQNCHSVPIESAGQYPGQPNWAYIHHGPYPRSGPCVDCHGMGMGGDFGIPCENCHFHGGDDSWILTTGRPSAYLGMRTF